jgi:hypothetical protein
MAERVQLCAALDLKAEGLWITCGATVKRAARYVY